MNAEDLLSPTSLERLEEAGDALAEKLGGGRKRKYMRFLIAALSGIPWVGGVITASTGLSAEEEQGQVNELHRLWLAEHQQKARELIGAIISLRHMCYLLHTWANDRIVSTHKNHRKHIL
jgi:hypothetical protein